MNTAPSNLITLDVCTTGKLFDGAACYLYAVWCCGKKCFGNGVFFFHFSKWNCVILLFSLFSPFVFVMCAKKFNDKKAKIKVRKKYSHSHISTQKTHIKERLFVLIYIYKGWYFIEEHNNNKNKVWCWAMQACVRCVCSWLVYTENVMRDTR